MVGHAVQLVCSHEVKSKKRVWRCLGWGAEWECVNRERMKGKLPAVHLVQVLSMHSLFSSLCLGSGVRYLAGLFLHDPANVNDS